MNNLTLDVLIGLVLIYLVFSIFISPLTEYLANGAGSTRATNLKKSLQSAFGAQTKKDRNADGLVDAFLQNGIILTLHRGKRGPSSIPEPLFAKGLIATLQKEMGLTNRPTTPAEFVSTTSTALDGNRFKTKPQLLQTLESLVKGNETDWTGFEKALADWFTEVGERSIGWYKRQIEWWKFGIGLGLAMIINIDSLLIFKVLSIDSRSRQELVATAGDTLIAANVLPQDEKTRQALAAITPDSPMQHRLDVDQGISRALGALRNSQIDNKEFQKYVQSRCLGLLDPSSQEKDECDADLYVWYPQIRALRDGFRNAFDRIDCEADAECSARIYEARMDSDANKQKRQEARKREDNQIVAANDALTEFSSEHDLDMADLLAPKSDISRFLNKLVEEKKQNISKIISEIHDANSDLTTILESKNTKNTTDKNNQSYDIKNDIARNKNSLAQLSYNNPTGKNGEILQQQKERLSELERHLTAVKETAVKVRNLLCGATGEKCPSTENDENYQKAQQVKVRLEQHTNIINQIRNDLAKAQSAVQARALLLNYRNRSAAVTATTAENELNPKGCGISAQASGAEQLNACLIELIGITNNLNLVLGVPAASGKDSNVRKMMDSVVTALTQARQAAEKRIPLVGRSTERFCSRIGESILTPVDGKPTSPPATIAKVDTERQQCTEIFKRARNGELGIPLTWDPDLVRLRFHMNVPGALYNDKTSWDWFFNAIYIGGGFLLTAIALSLGSEFWFNGLGRLMAIRLSGARRAIERETEAPPTQDATSRGGAGGAADGPVSPAGAAYFPNALTAAEARLSKNDILRIQGEIGMSAPLTGELDNPTRQAIHAWHQRRGGADKELWALEERHVNELLSGQPTALGGERLDSVLVLPGASSSPISELKLESRGEDVRLFKTLLSSTLQGSTPLLPSSEVDDHFDDLTQQVTQDFQSGRGLSRDGIVGPATWLRMTSDLNRLPAGLRDHLWMSHAIHEIGESEIRGRKDSNPRIDEYQKTTGAASNDDIAWCSSFAKWVLQQAGIDSGTVTAVASSWCDWGVPDSQYTFGSIIVIKQKGRKLEQNGSGAHVGFLVQVVNGRYFILGGNQGTPGMVNVTAFPEGVWEVLAVRKPTDEQVRSSSSQQPDDSTLAQQAGPTYPYFSVFPSRPRLQRGSTERQAVAELQDRLNQTKAVSSPLVVDGIFGPNTENAVRAFQKKMAWFQSSGVVDEATWSALEAAGNNGSERDPGTTALSTFLSNEKLTMAHVLAVREVESNGSGMVMLLDKSKKPRILFEGHQFHRLLKQAGVSETKLSSLRAKNPTIVYPKWVKSHYLSATGEWTRIKTAQSICKDIKNELKLPKGCGTSENLANMAASWGLFQIMGFNWELCGCKDVDDFVTKNMDGEKAQTALFLEFLKKQKNGALITDLRNQDWAAFAESYNGSGYRENRYDLKLKLAFDKFSA